MQLFPHQTKIKNDIFDKLNYVNSLLVQSATGSGKTVIMAACIEYYHNLFPDDIIFVSVHREELVKQTSMTLARFGVLNETITSGSRKFNTSFSNVYVGMTQTVYARKINLDVKLFVIDEAHEQVHLKTFGFFPNAKRIGFTATPIVNQSRTYYKCNYCHEKYDFVDKCCYNESTEKWKEPVTLSEQYEDIVLGPPIKWLIENGFLVDEIVFSYNYYVDVVDIEDEDEIAIESAKHDDQVLREYIEKAHGKKTMIFTASTKQNKTLVDTFINDGHAIRSYDSVNNSPKERTEVVDWFRKTEGAILVSTGTFTTGFDVREVECIMVNRPTKSLSLWHQIVGRGGRTSDKIFKENFIVIDLGGNTMRLGKWSDEIDWRKIFFEGLAKPKKRKETLIQCDKCFYNWIGCEGDTCPDCGHTNVDQNPMSRGERQSNELQTLKGTSRAEREIPLPNPAKIADFVIRTTNEKKDFFKIIIDRYVDLFKLNCVSRKIYQNRIDNGSLEIKIDIYIERMYNHHARVQNGQFRTKNWIRETIKTKLADIYK